MATVDEMSRGLGRVEGKLDLVLARLEAADRRDGERRAVDDEHGRRLRSLELLAAKVGGISVTVSAVAGVVVSVLREKFL
jgi:hypothetical protein